ncbi:hypothetical protein MMC34_006354 [Xylographa carneopallida]|nr:hypothetical protein [Xylographa carneopallida]
MGISFSSPQLQGAQTVAQPYAFSTSYGFAASDTNAFGVLATLGGVGGAITPIVTVPGSAAGLSSTYTCNTFPSSISIASLDCPGLYNSDIFPGTVTIALTSSPIFGGTYVFSVAATPTSVVTATVTATSAPTVNVQGTCPTTTSPSTTAHPTTSKLVCNADNCLRPLRATQTPGRLSSAQAFCSSYTNGAAVATPTYIPAECNPSRISSACACIAPTSTPVSTLAARAITNKHRRDVGFAGPDFTYSNGMGPAAVTVTTTPTAVL